MPTIARSSDMCMFTSGEDEAGHYFTQRELAFSQGWPSIPSIMACRKYDACISYDLHSLSRRKQTALQGNGMHLASMSSFMLFIFGHLLRRDVVAEFLPPLRILDDSEPETLEPETGQP